MLHFSEFYPKCEIYQASKKKKNIDYLYECDTIYTFDIEVSSAWLCDGELIPYKAGYDESYWNDMEQYSVPYIWQFGQNDTIYYGRELADFIHILEKFDKQTHIIIYIHNASYEFQFLCNILMPWKSIFARSPHKPMKFVSELFPNIEFRCSYYLTRMSLDTWGKNVGFNKLHTLDYNLIRTPNTHLTDEELLYCEYDCLVMYHGLLRYLERYKHIERIPLTQTGEVRRVARKVMRTGEDGKCDYRLIRKIVTMLPKNIEEYVTFKKVFQGGYTHANYILSGYVHRGIISQWDFASSYPYCMCACKFPMSYFFECSYDESRIEELCYILIVDFKNVRSKTYNHYISVSKCENLVNARTDNGRLISCDSCRLYLTELDFEIIKRTYDFDFTIAESYASRKNYLPKAYILYTLELYNNKTLLKTAPQGVSETAEETKLREDNYVLSKEFINALFGMMVTDLLNDDVIMDENGIWSIANKSVDNINNYLEELQTNNKGKTFLSYAWGLYVTAWGRYNLWKCILHEDSDNNIINDSNVIYVDTDSLKMRTTPNFDWYNQEASEKLRAMCDYYNIDFSLTEPVDPKGNPHPLGRLEREDDATEFITLGAKRYCYRSAKDGKLHLTVAGINKGAVDLLDDNIENFNENLKFDKDAPCVTKKYHAYNNNMKPIVWNRGQYDEYYCENRFGITIRPTGYSMSIADEYRMLIGLDEVVELNVINNIIKGVCEK